MEGTAERVEPALRLATADDRDAIDALMKASTRDLFPAFYDQQQTASSVVHISRFGFVEVGREVLDLPDRVRLDAVAMEMTLAV